MNKSEVLKIIEDHANKEKKMCGLFIPKSSFKKLSSKIAEATTNSTAIDELIENYEDEIGHYRYNAICFYIETNRDSMIYNGCLTKVITDLKAIRKI